MKMRFNKIFLIHFLALDASIIKEKYLNGIRETFDESVALLRNVTVETGLIIGNKTSMIMTKFESTFESVFNGDNSTITTNFEPTEKSTEKPCDWSWGMRHACAITGFVIGFIGFPVCLCACGFRPAGVAGGSCAAGVQR